jgi:3-oxoacyl-[acyl-carrier-protein] synthase-3
LTGINIIGTGSYLPEKVVTNADFESFLDTSDEWIVSHTGISRRHIAVDEPTWYMGAEAAKKAVKAAGIDPDEIGLIIGTTISSDYAFPSMACLVQEAIGNTTAFVFDISAACAGFPYALDVARNYLASGSVKAALIVSAETLTQVTDFTDRASCVLFGDGAGAAVVTAGDGLFGSYLRATGSGGQFLYSRRPVVKTPFHGEELTFERDPFPAEGFTATKMDGHAVYRFATKAMPESVEKACEAAGITVADLDLVIPHQANLRIIKTAMKNLGLPLEKAHVMIQETANTSSATIPICLDDCVRSGRLQKGDKFALTGFGSGLVYGACVLEF